MPRHLRTGGTARRRRSAGGAPAVLALLAGCTAPLAVPAGPDAADPLCAEVVLALPTSLGGMPQLPTGSQATTAWGDRTAPVVLRCGVERPPPSTSCVTVTDGAVGVDWVADPGEGSRWTFTTFGRDPAVEVVVPAPDASATTPGESVLLELGRAVSQVPATQVCS